ncbi:MAG: PP2C family protein-serine/threonine phosphatase, partial [Bacteroidota bacterium]
MANKKLRNFEFAYHTEKGNDRQDNTDEMLFFECDNGSVFLICQDSAEHNLEISPASLAAQRIKYYLENEFVANADEALFNALVYTNGFIYEYGRKHNDYSDVYVHSACILIRDNKVYFAVIGDLAVYFFNGRRPFLLKSGDSEGHTEASAKSDADTVKSQKEKLLGQSKHIHPVVNHEALVPLNDDMLLMCSHGFYEKVNERNIQKILSDPMPVQTKLYRLLDMASIAGGEENISLHLISFYNLDHTERRFVAIDPKKPRIKKRPESAGTKKDDDEIPDNETSGEVGRVIDNPVVRRIILVVAILILAYMFYDIFIRDPMPPVKLENTQQEEPADTEAESTENELLQQSGPESSSNIPGDTLYTVRSGDTWGRIYSRFGVCSWFRRNHTP